MEGKTVQIICPECQNKFYTQITSSTQTITCPFCHFYSQISFQTTHQPQYPQYQSPEYVPYRAYPPGKSSTKYLVGLAVVVIILILIFAGVFLLYDISSPAEEELGELAIVSIDHTPSSPGTDDIVQFSAEIVNCPSKYSVYFNDEVYNGSVLIMYGRGFMGFGRGAEGLYTLSQDLRGTGYESGYEVRYWITVFDNNADLDEDPPVLSSEENSFIIS